MERGCRVAGTSRIVLEPDAVWGLVCRGGEILGRIRRLPDGAGFVYFRGAYNVTEPAFERATLAALEVAIHDD